MSDPLAGMFIDRDDPRTPDVFALLTTHLEFAQEVTPPDHVHALDVVALTGHDITFFSARSTVGALLGVGALRHLDDTHGEIKSMHTAVDARGKGIGRAMVQRLVGEARARGYVRLSLETGTEPEFAPARSLYVAAGFEACDPFGAYTENEYSLCMTMWL